MTPPEQEKVETTADLPLKPLELSTMAASCSGVWNTKADGLRTLYALIDSYSKPMGRRTSSVSKSV